MAVGCALSLPVVFPQRDHSRLLGKMNEGCDSHTRGRARPPCHSSPHATSACSSCLDFQDVGRSGQSNRRNSKGALCESGSHPLYNVQRRGRSPAAMPDHPLPPIVYLPSSGGYTSSRIVPEVRCFHICSIEGRLFEPAPRTQTPDRKRFPFRRYSIDDDGKLVCKTRNVARDT